MSDFNTAPAWGAAAVTKSDSTTFTRTRGLYVGGAGDVALDVGGTVVTFVGVPAGALLPVSFLRVMSTNTTATSMVALY